MKKCCLCYLCKSQICPDKDTDYCNCEIYWRHSCRCGYVCSKHNVAYWYDDTYCIYCYDNFYPNMKYYTPRYENYCKELLIKLKAAQYWMSIAPKLNVCKDVANMINLLLIT